MTGGAQALAAEAAGGRPPAEVAVSARQARAMVAAQAPHLAGLPVRRIAEGWDNVTFRLGRDLALRLPRRAVAAGLLETELAWLPRLAPALPVPVPAAVHAGAPVGHYPWRWSVVPWIPAHPAGARGLADAGAEALAGFLQALHALPVPGDAPRSAVRGVGLAARSAVAQRGLDRLSARAPDLGDRAARLWARALRADREEPDVWLHGDLHPGNVIATAAGGLAGVIDWGDMCAGDPATDLAALWMLVRSPEARAAAAARLGTARACLDRARGWALSLGLVLADSGEAETGLAILQRCVDQD